MARVIYSDLRKLFGSYHIYICMVGLGLVYILMYFATLSVNVYIFGIVQSFREVAQGSEIMLVSFLLSIVGGSFLYCAEEKHGYLGFEIQRIGIGRYTVSKLITSVIGGFSTVIMGSCIYICGILAHQFFVFGRISFVGEDMAYLIWFLLVSALRCSMLSAIGFLVSTYVPNYYIAMTVPLLIYYTILTVEYYVSVFLPFIPSEFYFTDRYFAGIVEGRDFVFSLLYTVCILVIMYRMAKERIERRMEHA